MKILSFVHLVWTTYLLLVLSDTCTASTQSIGRISPPFQGSQINWVDNQGLFLLSNSGEFAFGFSTRQDITSFLLGIIHVASLRVVWTANIGSPVTNSDKFVFGNDGNAYLESGSSVVWSTNTTGNGGATIELQDTGNLVLLSNDSRPLWQSFSNPTDTLLSGQNFTDGMKLTSSPNSNNLVFHLKFESGDLMFYADFVPPQPYWSMQEETRKTIDKVGGDVSSAALVSNSWKAYDRNDALLWQFIFAQDVDLNITWAAVLGNDGSFSFYNLQNRGQGVAENIRIPQDSCQTPEPCGPYSICSSNNRCQCPVALNSYSTCNTDIVSNCSSNSSVELVSIEDGLGYFAIDFVSPIGKSSLEGCKKLCMDNCSCLALFLDEKSGKCFLFDQLGSLQQSNDNSNGYVSYIKISGSGNSSPNKVQEGSSGKKPYPIIVAISLAIVLVISTLIYFAVRYIRRKNPSDASQNSSEEDTFLENLSGMPIRFSYRELQTATNDFSVKLGKGGFGSVYRGVLSDGSQVAVKKLECIGQGNKEFRAEVSTIGSIHHFHLVRLRGFCAEGMHRLLAYEYMANGSLDRWIFQKGREGFLLDWDKRFSIALAMAKGLAYLHEDCNVKIVHCDIKPENVLLDENYSAKVADFGLAKLMTREQSHVFTTLRGTRGYLAPEWLINHAISEKSDVYSFGMVLLEIIGGRRNFDRAETSEKAHFPSYAFKKMEEGKLQEILDDKIQFDETDERVPIVIKVALWCIQEDMRLRPSMTKVVQMLEGLSDVRQLPISGQLGFRMHSNVLESVTLQSAVSLSGPSIPSDVDVLIILHYDGNFQSDLKGPQYIGGRQKVRHLPKTITYSELVNVALEASNWEASVEASCIKHLLHNGSFFSLIDIDDDNDVKGMFRALGTYPRNNILLFVARREGDTYATKETPETRNNKRQVNKHQREALINEIRLTKAKELVIEPHTKEFPTIDLNEDCDFNFPSTPNGMIGEEEPIICALGNDASMDCSEDVHYYTSIPSISRYTK